MLQHSQAHLVIACVMLNLFCAHCMKYSSWCFLLNLVQLIFHITICLHSKYKLHLSIFFCVAVEFIRVILRYKNALLDLFLFSPFFIVIC